MASATILRPGAFLAALFLILAAPAAQAACLLGMVERGAPGLIRAGFAPAQVPAGKVRIAYLGHSSFLIETPAGATAVTDYNGVNVPAEVPDIVTMNNSHGTHYTDAPQDGIRHVLRGWEPGGGMARHDVRHRDLRVFNVPTNIGEWGDPGSNNNSVFVFEIANLCIAHLGHLHHVLTPEQRRAVGRIDVLFVPVDGAVTLTHDQALAVIGQLEPRLVIPMHFGFFGAADAFFEKAKALYPIRAPEASEVSVDRNSLPGDTEILFLQAGLF